MTCAESVARSVVAVDRRSTRARTNGDLIVSFGVSWFSHASITAWQVKTVDSERIALLNSASPG